MTRKILKAEILRVEIRGRSRGRPVGGRNCETADCGLRTAEGAVIRTEAEIGNWES